MKPSAQHAPTTVEHSAEDLIVEDLEAPTKGRSDGAKMYHRPSRVVGTKWEEGTSPKKTRKLLWQRMRLLGAGGFGHVYLGLDGNTGTLIAGKEFTFDLTRSEDRSKLNALQQEIKVMRHLNHRNTVKYLGADRRGGTCYIFMEYVPGGSLRSLLDQFGVLQEGVASSFTRQILHGLGYLHRNQVIHRDVKSANVLVTVDGVVKLADFGSAQFFRRIKGMEGTPFWMAPEVLGSSQKVGWQADIWSLGCTVLEMLTGATPFRELGNTEAILSYVAKGVGPVVVSSSVAHPAARDFISLCLNRNPERRPTVKQLLQHDFIYLSRRPGSAESLLSLANSLSSFVSTGGAEVNEDDAERLNTAEEDEALPLDEELRGALYNRALSITRLEGNPLQDGTFSSETLDPALGADSVVNLIKSSLEGASKDDGIEFDVDQDSAERVASVNIANLPAPENRCDEAGDAVRERCYLRPVQRVQIVIAVFLVAAIAALVVVLVLKV